MDVSCPHQEVIKGLPEAKAAHADFSAKHEKYTMAFNEKKYEEAEAWMEECTQEYTRFIMLVNDYNASVEKENKDAEIIDR